MKMKSNFNFTFAFNERSSRRFSVKTIYTYSLPLYPIVFSICICSLLRLSQIIAKIRNIYEKNLSVVYANDTVLRDVCLTDYFS